MDRMNNTDMSLDYQRTCPQIDEEIDNIKIAITEKILDLCDDLSPMLSQESKIEISENTTENIYNSISDMIETIRSTNENIRYAATNQIEFLQNRIFELEDRLIDLN